MLIDFWLNVGSVNIYRKFTRPLDDAEVDEKQSICLECETSHTVSTKWQFDGKELTGMDHRELHQEGRVHRLVIKKSSVLDSGKYTCLVKDQSTSSTVVVHDVKAEFVKKLEDIEVKENDCAILEVEVSSDTTDVSWHKVWCARAVLILETKYFIIRLPNTLHRMARRSSMA